MSGPRQSVGSVLAQTDAVTPAATQKVDHFLAVRLGPKVHGKECFGQLEDPPDLETCPLGGRPSRSDRDQTDDPAGPRPSGHGQPFEGRHTGQFPEFGPAFFTDPLPPRRTPIGLTVPS